MKKQVFLRIGAGIIMWGVSLLWNQTSAYLEDKVYCSFSWEEVVIYLKKEEGTNKCAEYIKAIQQLAKDKYDESMLVLNYIDQGDDVLYRQEIFEVKKQEFLKLVRQQSNILLMIQNFEHKFFLMYQELLAESLIPYLENLKKSQLQRQSLDPYDEKTRIISQQIAQQILIVQTILNATNLDEIMNQVSAYLYLEKQLGWK